MSQPPCTILLFKPKDCQITLAFYPGCQVEQISRVTIVLSQVVCHVFTGLVQAFNRHSYFSWFWVCLWELPRHVRGLGRWRYTDRGAQFLSFQSTDTTGARTTRKIQLHRVSSLSVVFLSYMYSGLCLWCVPLQPRRLWELIFPASKCTFHLLRVIAKYLQPFFKWLLFL